MNSIAERLLQIDARITAAAERCGRKRPDIQLMAVSKFHPAAEVIEAIQSGQLLFGENRVQEADDKFTPLFDRNPRPRVHLIGSLQRNKAGKAAALFDCVQSIDRRELLMELGRQCTRRDKVLDILFELHTAEDSKSGYRTCDELWESIDLLSTQPHLRCRGLMTMAPFTNDEGAIRRAFRKLADTRRQAEARWPELDFSVLSMGMSNDYSIAIEEGSTLIRIGTAIFGERT